MKKILITGKHSYIGESVEAYLLKDSHYTIDTLDMLDSTWKKHDFSAYDVVFHVAGIAHSDNGKISEEREKIYYKVNTDLAVEVAFKARNEGVTQFIYMSSMSVYGNSSNIGEKKMITLNTKPNPVNAYGKSKLLAEEYIIHMDSPDFRVVVLRPPMIYGKNSRGNYKTLSNLAIKLSVFPEIENKRSMLYVENLCEFVRLMITNNERGIFMPQNKEYTQTSHMVSLIAHCHNKNIVMTKKFNFILKLMSKYTTLVNKAFGNLAYEQSMSSYKEPYQVIDFEDSIKRTEEI